jgi:hypothetical protein
MKRYVWSGTMRRPDGHVILSPCSLSKVKPLTRRSFGPILPSAVRGAHQKAIGTKETVSLDRI